MIRWLPSLVLLGCAPSLGELSPRLAFPLADRNVVDVVIGMDGDDERGSGGLVGDSVCADHLGRGFPHCYNNHDGTDYTLRGGFEAMDAGSVSIVAAAPGRVVFAHDGEYDRCRATLDGVSCDGHDIRANAVIVEHANGTRTLYWHMKKGSVAVARGDEVEVGTHLGLVGSSGISSLPHLHFEVQLMDGRAIDPYAGPGSHGTSLWCLQDAGDGLPGGCP